MALPFVASGSCVRNGTCHVDEARVDATRRTRPEQDRTDSVDIRRDPSEGFHVEGGFFPSHGHDHGRCFDRKKR